MRERLIELLTKTFDEQYDRMRLITPKHTADHLLANGVIVPPCKVGDTVRRVTKIYADVQGVEKYTILKGEVRGVYLHPELLMAYCVYEDGLPYWHKADDFGKTVFLTKEEAEQALKGGVE